MIRKLLETYILADKIPYLEGAPGSGKSATVKALARQYNKKLFIVYLAHRAGNEIHGIPVIRREPLEIAGKPYTVVEPAPPRELIQALHEPGGAVLFFDEVNQLSPHDMGQLMSIFSERRWADIELPRDKIDIIAAGNPPSMSAGGFEFPLPMRRRIVHIPFVVQAAEFAAPENFPTNWGAPLPPIIKMGRPLRDDMRFQYRERLAAWVRNNPDCFIIRDIAAAASGFVCPATLEDAADVLAAANVAELPAQPRADLTVQLLRGVVGEAAAAAIAGALERVYSIDVLAALRDPDGFIAANKAPAADQLYYFCMAMAAEQRRLTWSTKHTTATRKAAIASLHAAIKILAFLLAADCPYDILVMTATSLMNDRALLGAPDCPGLKDLGPLVKIVQRAGLDASKLSFDLGEIS